jgi:hypothetical protein
MTWVSIVLAQYEEEGGSSALLLGSLVVLFVAIVIVFLVLHRETKSRRERLRDSDRESGPPSQ